MTISHKEDCPTSPNTKAMVRPVLAQNSISSTKGAVQVWESGGTALSPWLMPHVFLGST